MKSFKQHSGLLFEAYDVIPNSVDEIDDIVTTVDKEKLKAMYLAVVKDTGVENPIALSSDKGNETVKLMRGLYPDASDTQLSKKYQLKVQTGNGSRSSGGSPSGAEWESIITSEYNRLIGSEGSDKNADKIASQFDDIFIERGKNIAKSFIKKIGQEPMTQYGGGGGKGNLSAFWTSYGGSDGTPKSDMYTKSYNISLKKSGGSQLGSSGKSETVAMYNAALEYMGGASNKHLDKILKSIEDNFAKVYTKHTKGTLEKMASDPDNIKPQDQQAVEQFIETEEFHKELNKEIKDKLKFEDEPEFVKWFVYEAMSGYKKFDNRIAAASICIEFDETSGNLKVINITPDGSNKGLRETPSVNKEVEAIAKKVKIYSSWKSSGGNPYSVMRIALNKQKKVKLENAYIPTLRGIIRETLMNDNISGMLLKEDLQQLDEFRIIGSVLNTLTKLGKNAKVWFTNLVKTIMAAVSKAFDQIRKLGAKAYHALLGFLGLEVADAGFDKLPKEYAEFIFKSPK